MESTLKLLTKIKLQSSGPDCSHSYQLTILLALDGLPPEGGTGNRRRVGRPSGNNM